MLQKWKAEITSEIRTSLSELIKTNNEKVNEFENKVTQAATGLINEHIHKCSDSSCHKYTGFT